MYERKQNGEYLMLEKIFDSKLMGFMNRKHSFLKFVFLLVLVFLFGLVVGTSL